MRKSNEIYAAFAQARRPSAQEITDHAGDSEREKIRDLLAPHAATDVPSEELGKYPLYTMIPLLSAASYRYFMPRLVAYCLERPDSVLAESLLFSLSGANAARIASFLPVERAVVREYIDHLAQQSDAHIDAEDITTARTKWNAV